jgi:hypothetical protein
MTAPSPAKKKRFGLWITLSELVGVLALVIAGLNYWDSHRERADDARRQAAAERQTAARSALVLKGEPQGGGARLALSPLDPGEAIQSQRFIFPADMRPGPVELTAARPQVDVDWIADGLRRQVALMRKDGAGADGAGSVPLGVATTYVEDGEMRTDRSLYRVGYAWRGRLLGGPALTLQGLSLVRRGVAGELGKTVEAAWRRSGG